MKNLAAIGCLSVIIVTPFAALWRAFVLMKLWAWFVVPAFGLQPISMITAFGLAVLISFGFMTPSASADDGRKDDADEAKELIMTIGYGFLWPALGLVVGWIGLQFA